MTEFHGSAFIATDQGRVSVNAAVVGASVTIEQMVVVSEALPALPADAGCPYPGLEAFREGWGEVFHGRGEETEQVLAALVEHPLSAVVGASGSGKSSLLAAGVAYRLAQGARAGSERWAVTLLGGPKAQGMPVEALCEALRDAYRKAGQPLPDQSGSTLPDALRADPALFGRLSARLARLTGERVVWLLDQFESFLVPGRSDADVACVAEAVLSVRDAAASPPVHAVVAVRTDMYHRLDAAPRLAAELSAHQTWLQALSGGGLSEAVREPAASAERRVEKQLVDRITADAGNTLGTLPLVAYALRRVWEEDAPHGILRLSTYERIGGIGAVLEGDAQQSLDGLDEAGRATARRTLVRLAHVGRGERPTRRVVLARELITDVDDEAAVVSVLEPFVRKRLLVVGRRRSDGEVTVAVAHEVLLEKWRRLRQWLEEDPAAKRLQETIAQATAQWLDEDRNEAFVLSPGELGLLDRLDGRLWRFNAEEAAFVATSRRVAERARHAQERARALLRRWVVTAVCLVVAVAVAAALFRAEQRTARAKREVDALRLSAQARSAAGERRDVAALLAAAAVRTDDAPANRAALVDVLAAPGGQLAVHRPVFGAAVPNALAAVPAADGSLVVGGSDGAVRRLDPLTGRIRGVFGGRHGDGVSAVALGGGLVVSGDVRGGVLVRSAAVGTGEAAAWDAAAEHPDAGTVVRLRMPGSAGVTAVAVDATARTVLAGSTDGVVARWTVRGAGRGVVRIGAAVEALAVHRPGAFAAAATERDHVLEIPTAGRGVPRPVPGSALGAAIGNAAAGNTLATLPGGALAAVDGARLHLFSGPSRPRTAPAPRSTAVVAAGGTVYVGDADGRVRAWSTADVAQPRGEALTGPPGEAITALATDGRVLAALGQEGRLVVWDLTDRRSPAAVPGPPAPAGRPVTSVAHGPDGTLAAGDARGAVRLSGPGPFAGTRLDLPGEAAVTALAWTGPAGLVAGTANGTLYGVDVAGRRHDALAERAATAVVDVRTAPDGTVLAAWKDRVLIHVPGREAVPLEGFAGEHVRAVALGPHGEVAVSHGTADGARTVLWRGDAAVSAPRELTTGHRLFVAALAFSPDGRTLATGSDDRSVALWDVRTGTRLARMPAGHTDTVRALAWSRDGRLASGGEDATVRLWDTRAPGPAIGMPLRYQDGSPVTALSASPDGRELTALYGTATVTWPFSPASWSRLACTFAAGVRDSPQDVAGYAGGAGPADGCP